MDWHRSVLSILTMRNEDAEDEEEEEHFKVHPGLQPNNTEDKIGQLDGLEDIDELLDEDEQDTVPLEEITDVPSSESEEN